ncbi:MAG: hypothetical protein H6807_08160 [Planctomycetes bacterium]|nr:hypothetical protein [Planctomycetota bacterium]
MRIHGGQALVFGLLMCLAAPLGAQNETGGENPPGPAQDEKGYTFQIGKEGMKFEAFVEMAATLTGKTFVYDSRRLNGQNKVINMIGVKRVKEEDLMNFLQILFFTHNMAIMPIGPPETEVFLIDDIQTSQLLKQRAVYVDLDDLEARSKRVGEIVATTVPLKYIPVEKAQRALNNIIQEHRAGFVHPIEESNSLLITNFAPTVWAMYQMILAMDVAVPENQLYFEQLPLEYHVAEELAPIIEDLMEVRSDISSSGSTAQPGAQPIRPRRGASNAQGGPPAPRIIADPRNNSLLVYAVEDYMAEIKRLVAQLDTEVTEQVSNIHYYELKNTNAGDIQEVLNDLLRGTGSSGQRPTGSGSRSNTRTNTNTPGAAASASLDEINIVADENTNSLLITATRARFEEVAEIIEKLDKRRPQVLVQAAIAELSDNDLENIGVEIAQVEGGGSEARLFGATNFGLSTIDTIDNLNSGGTGTGTGGGTGGTAVTDMFFDDLVRVPNLDAQGLITGVFSNFVEVPLLVQLFKQTNKGNLVSVPSILVNDNQEAHIIVGNEIPTTAVNQGQFSDQTSFQGYQSANLELAISPSISNDNYLRLNISLTVEAFTGAQTNSSVPPPKTTREVQTNITVQSGRTVVIGGLTTDNLRETVTGIPLLSDIPVLGYLFRNTGTQHDRTTLYVFITPTILKDFEALERISYERKLEIAKLDGQINIVDPNFRELDLDDEDVDIEAIERSGHLDLPRFKPTVPLAEPDAMMTPNADGVPVKPVRSAAPMTGEEGAKASTIRIDPGADIFSAPPIDAAANRAAGEGRETRNEAPAADREGVRRADLKPAPAGGF